LIEQLNRASLPVLLNTAEGNERALSDRKEISLGSNLSISRRLAILLVLRPRLGIEDRGSLLGWKWKEDE
jgi:hypothetical protein